ncbi:hypothetical protein K8I85_05180 [bacterium]|nr:hypothetical protein [bacterium]
MIRMIAWVLVGTGAWVLVGLRSSYLHPGTALRMAAEYAGLWLAIVLAAQLLVPALKTAAGLGLLLRKRWGRAVALVALPVDVLTLGVSIARLHAAAAPPDPLAAGTVVRQVSAVPMYVIFALSLVSLVLLGRKPSRDDDARRGGHAAP